VLAERLDVLRGREGKGEGKWKEEVSFGCVELRPFRRPRQPSEELKYQYGLTS